MDGLSLRAAGCSRGQRFLDPEKGVSMGQQDAIHILGTRTDALGKVRAVAYSDPGDSGIRDVVDVPKHQRSY